MYQWGFLVNYNGLTFKWFNSKKMKLLAWMLHFNCILAVSMVKMSHFCNHHLLHKTLNASKISAFSEHFQIHPVLSNITLQYVIDMSDLSGLLYITYEKTEFNCSATCTEHNRFRKKPDVKRKEICAQEITKHTKPYFACCFCHQFSLE